MKCEKLNLSYVVDEIVPDYEDLFSKSLEKRMIIVEILRTNLKERTKILNQTWSWQCNIGPGEQEDRSIFHVLQYIRLYMIGINIYIYIYIMNFKKDIR